MSEITSVGLDLAKNVFQVHGAAASGLAVLRKKLRRAQVLESFGQLPTCVVAMEACGAHYLGREIGKLGHEVRLIPPAYVKPLVKRQKNDAADAEVQRHGLAVPRDVSVVSFDDIELVAHLSPPLTTIRQPRMEIGRLVATRLLAMLANEVDAEDTILPVELVIRSSTTSPRDRG